MLEIVKDRIPSISRPRIHNPFRIEPVGEATYLRLQSLEPDEADAEFKAYDEVTKQLYRDYLSARDNRDIAKSALGITAAGLLVGGLVAVITSGDDDDEDYEDEEDDDEDDYDFDDEDEDESSDS